MYLMAETGSGHLSQLCEDSVQKTYFSLRIRKNENEWEKQNYVEKERRWKMEMLLKLFSFDTNSFQSW